MERSATAPSRPALSVVAPCFNEAACLDEFHRRAAAAAAATAGEAHEIILVDDGSRDGTWAAMRRLAESDPHVVAVRLMRNHGHQIAASAGLALARGERVLLIDADLQDPPEILPEMDRLMTDADADVVFGRRTVRHGETAFKRWSAAGFYLLLSRLSGVEIPRNVGDFRLMRRRVVEALNAMPERRRFLRGMVSWVGGRQVAFPYARAERHAGRSNYPLARMIRLAVDALISFSTVPLRLAAMLGFGSIGVALLLGAFSVEAWIAGRTVAGWASVMTAIVFFSAMQLLVLSVLGSYLGRLSEESKGRPLFLVDQVCMRGRSHGLPADFASLPPALRDEVWEATRAALPPAE